VLPDEAEIIKAWHDDYGWRYPFKDRADLTRVSQFVALTHFDPLAPHRDLAERCSKVPPPNYQDPDEPHAVLAALPLSLYLTTNQDEFMRMALESRRIKATCAFFPWNEGLRELETTEARPAQPADGALVYHLLGHYELPESLVRTEDDYIRYVTHVAANKKALFPSAVTSALATKFLLFIGYGAFDWSFRILVHTLLQAHTARSLKQFGVAVQLARADVPDDQRDQVSKYLTEFLGQIGVRFSVLWRDNREFMRELHTRWESEDGHAAAS
jgi:hypothetical protein